MYAAYQVIQLILRLLVYTFIGKWLLRRLAGPGYRANPVWRLFDIVTRPIWRFTRMIMPAIVPDSAIGAVTILLLLAANLALYMLFFSQGWLDPTG